MTTQTTFTAEARHWKHNSYSSRAARVDLAEIHTPQGERVPGVAILVGSAPKMVITAEAAMRLAHELADALAQINTQEKKRCD